MDFLDMASKSIDFPWIQPKEKREKKEKKKEVE